MDFRSIAPLSAGLFGDRRRDAEHRAPQRATATATAHGDRPHDDGTGGADADHAGLPLPDAGVQLAVELAGSADDATHGTARAGGGAAGHHDVRDLRGKLTDETV